VIEDKTNRWSGRHAKAR